MKQLFNLNLLKFNKLKSHFLLKLKVRKILIFFGGYFSNRQFYRLISKISSKNQLIDLFSRVYFRLDFFLSVINFALNGKMARFLIKTRQIEIITNNRVITNSKNYQILLKIKDSISLKCIVIQKIKYSIIKRLIPLFIFLRFWSKLSLSNCYKAIFFITKFSFFCWVLQLEVVCSFELMYHKKYKKNQLKLLDFIEILLIENVEFTQKFLNKFGRIFNKIFGLGYFLSYFLYVRQFGKKYYFRKNKNNNQMLCASFLWAKWRYFSFLSYQFSRFVVFINKQPIVYSLKNFQKYHLLLINDSK